MSNTLSTERVSLKVTRPSFGTDATDRTEIVIDRTDTALDS
jgi:hypothetical protein